MRDIEDREKERNMYRTDEERVGSKNIKRDEESKYNVKIYMAEKGVQERWRESGYKELERCIRELYKNTIQYNEWVYFIEEKWWTCIQKKEIEYEKETQRWNETKTKRIRFGRKRKCEGEIRKKYWE